ncbi:hypothetical protein Cylst_3469 [Cylindrospermum stagnale PCC 7417]|uniref:Sporulation related protein n=1 Tax=Cylindrospermum stagnale PCC 7417 TaxID=56107 RepID=K9X0Q6_9NOST|nr:hypothetical protein [Cylindrospermum stagnale]AFZ25616.1 hypothetical protein Cylst_3469 [Cylindrospermum stagnale PCC 7417]
MSSAIPSRFITLPLLPFFLGGCLALIPHCNPAQAQQRRSEPLPPLPNLQEVPTNQQPVEFSNQNYQPSQPVKFSQNTQNFERYFVYVDSDNPQILQRVRQIERSAYTRPFNGRTVIQSGVFSTRANAQQRVDELASNGIYGVGIASFSNTEETVISTNGGNSRNDRRDNSNYYYVAIPAKSQSLANIVQRIRQNISPNISVLSRNQPRGWHVAVGPFTQRLEAEQWNKYLQNFGYGNARVYYGR